MNFYLDQFLIIVSSHISLSISTEEGEREEEERGERREVIEYALFYADMIFVYVYEYEYEYE